MLVVTSKVLSKCEGRLVPAPEDPEARDALRRKLVDAESVRVLARKGRTLITENGLGVVQAASGVDGSNIGTDELALLPVDPDGSAASLRAGLRERLGVTVGVVITDTMGRAWRNGQTDAAVGAAGISVLHGYAGAVDRHGNELLVTEVAIADEIAAAADLVKGKLTAIPVAVVRGLPAGVVTETDATARHLVRSGTDDLFWLGTAEALELGRQQAQLLRRSVRQFTDEPVPPQLIEDAVAEALTAPAPHHTRPVRFVWLQTPATRSRLLERMRDKWRADLTGDGRPADAVERRVARGQILYDAPEVVIPMLVPDGAHSYPDAARTDAEHTMFTVAVGAAVQALLVALAVRGVGSCWIGSTIFAADLVRDELEPARRLGTVGRHRHRLSRAARDRASPTRRGQRSAGAQVSVRASAIALLSDWQAPDRSQDSLRNAVLAFLDAREDACLRECVPGHITASALVLDDTGGQVLLTLHPRLGRWVQLGGHCEDSDADIVGGGAAGGHRRIRRRRPADHTRPGRDQRPRADLLAGRADPSPRLAVRGAGAGRGADHGQRRISGPAVVADRRVARRHRRGAGLPRAARDQE